MAAFMATGHARYTGEVGVCLATQGPGAIHLLTGLYDAKQDRKPVVAIVGQVVASALGSVVDAQQIPMVLDGAFRTAIATSSPTCVVVTHDVQRAELPRPRSPPSPSGW
jgi:pyruvate dehydrogenase (quinone)